MDENNFENKNNDTNNNSENNYNPNDYIINNQPQNTGCPINENDNNTQQYGYVVKPTSTSDSQSNLHGFNAGYYQQADTQKKPKAKLSKALIFVMVICIVLTPILGVVGGYAGTKLALNNSNSSLAPSQNNTNVNVSTMKTEEGLSTSELSNLVKPMVVEITTETKVNSLFVQQYVTSGAGSGVILTDDGYIATNNHVIADSTSVRVRLYDGTEYDATFVGADQQTDLAVIKIDATNLPFAQIGDSNNLVVGQDVLAVGNPLGQLGGTVTNGIISALGRDVTIDGQTMSLLQTNAAINPGNSGGGLFNARGELVGIVNAKSSGGDVEGLGFAIPSNTVKTITDDLIKKGYVGGRISTGMTLINIDDDSTALRYGVQSFGVYVYSVTQSSSAEIAGLRTGDRIIKLNDNDIKTINDVKTIFEETGVGNTLNVEFERNGQKQTTTLLLTELVPENIA